MITLSPNANNVHLYVSFKFNLRRISIYTCMYIDTNRLDTYFVHSFVSDH